MRVRFRTTAGPHAVGATFQQTNLAPLLDLDKRFMRSTVQTGPTPGYSFFPHVGTVRIEGPFDAVAAKGLHIADLDGPQQRLSPSAIGASEDPAEAFAGAGLVLVTVKSRDTAEMAATVARHASPDAVVVSLQNGTANPGVLSRGLAPSQRAVAGMVPYAGSLIAEPGHDRSSKSSKRKRSGNTCWRSR